MGDVTASLGRGDPRRVQWLRVVAVWMVVGAAVSAAEFLDVLPQSGLPADTWQTVLVVVELLCALTVLAGRALFQRPETARGAALLVWALQVPSFRIGPLMYGVTLGPYACVGRFPDFAGVTAGFRPHVAFMLHTSAAAEATYGVNVLAMFAIVVIWRAARRAVAEVPAAPEEFEAVPARREEVRL